LRYKKAASNFFEAAIFSCKNACQLEGSDHGGRDSAAELALADTIDVQMSNDSYNRLTLESAPPDGRNYTPRTTSVNGFLKARSQGEVSQENQ